MLIVVELVVVLITNNVNVYGSTFFKDPTHFCFFIYLFMAGSLIKLVNQYKIIIIMIIIKTKKNLDLIKKKLKPYKILILYEVRTVESYHTILIFGLSKQFGFGYLIY